MREMLCCKYLKNNLPPAYFPIKLELAHTRFERIQCTPRVHISYALLVRPSGRCSL